MPPTFSRLLDEGTQERYNDPRTATVRFLVPGASESVALSNPNLPAVGEQHPDGINLIAGRRKAEQAVGSGTDSGWIVSVDYRPPGSPIGGATPPDRLASNFFTVEINTSSTVIQVPVLTGRTYNFFNGTAITQSFEWVNTPQDLVVPATRLTVTINTTGGADESIITACKAQVGKKHTFFGYDWVYEGASSALQQVNQWRFTHTWFNEDGNPAPDMSDLTNAGIEFVPIPARPAFSRYTVGYSGNNPLIRTLSYYPSVPTGYLTLPGNLGSILT